MHMIKKKCVRLKILIFFHLLMDEKFDLYKNDNLNMKENDFMDVPKERRENINKKHEYTLDFEINQLIELYQNHADIIDILRLIDDIGNNMTDSIVIFTDNNNKQQLFSILCEMLNSENCIFIENRANYMSIWLLTKLFKYCFDSFIRDVYDESLVSILINLYKNESESQIIIYIIALFEQIAIHYGETIPVILDQIIDDKIINIMKIENMTLVQELQNQICSFFLTISQLSINESVNESFLEFIVDILNNNHEKISLFALEELTTCLNNLSDKFSNWSDIIISKGFHDKIWGILNEKSVFTYPLLDTLIILLYYNAECVTINEDVIMKFLIMPEKTVVDKRINPQRLVLRLLKMIAIYKPSHPIFFNVKIIERLLSYCSQSIFLFRAKSFSVICESLIFFDTQQKHLYIERGFIPIILEFMNTDLSNTMIFKLLFAIKELLRVHNEFPEVLEQFYEHDGPQIIESLLDNNEISDETKEMILMLQSEYFPSTDS